MLGDSPRLASPASQQPQPTEGPVREQLEQQQQQRAVPDAGT
jgi:hypothetical protein